MTPDQTTRAPYYTAIAHSGSSLTQLPFTLAALPGGPLKEAAHTFAAEIFNDAGERSMRPRKPRNAGQFTPRKTARAFRAVLPAWALAAFTVCLAIPGPFDEIAAILASLVLLVVRFPRARSAWRGGKTHRKAAGR